ncbi:MAG: DUF3822 family protein [Bacteroidia bacterium]|nr:DUF3822 family protein [Bacteroidia bacterium]
MQTTALQYKLIKKIKDERFDEEDIHHYILLINIGTRDLQTAVIDSRDHRVLLMEDFVLPTLTSYAEQEQILSGLFDNHALLRVGFWKQVKIAIKNQKFIQVPDALFAEESLADYLRFNAQVDPDTEVFLNIHNTRTAAMSVFSTNRSMYEWLVSSYPSKSPVFVHQSAALIEGILEHATTVGHNPLYIYVDRFKLHIVSTRDGKLVYYNQFVIKQFSDYVRYIMLVLKSLNMDQRDSQVVLWGYIGKNSPHYHEFYKYINNVTFGARPGYLQFGYMFDEIQEHHFFDLFSIYLLD